MKQLGPNPYIVYRGYQIIPSYYSTWKCMEITFQSVQAAKKYIDKMLDCKKVKS